MANQKSTRRWMGTMPSGWWKGLVPPDANPTEVVEIVEAASGGGHPALPELRTIARAYEKARRVTEEHAPYRCRHCWDTGWIELGAEGRGLVKRCDCAATRPKEVDPAQALGMKRRTGRVS